MYNTVERSDVRVHIWTLVGVPVVRAAALFERFNMTREVSSLLAVRPLRLLGPF